MTLAELLADLPGPRTLENARAWLEQDITVPDATLVTARRVMADLTIAEAATLFGTLTTAAASNAPTAPLVAEALLQLRTNGLDLSHANARAMIDALFTTELAAKVKALGEKSVPRWQQTDLSRLKDGYILEAL